MYLTWTDTGPLWQVVYKGLRRPKPSPVAGSSRAAGRMLQPDCQPRNAIRLAGRSKIGRCVVLRKGARRFSLDRAKGIAKLLRRCYRRSGEQKRNMKLQPIDGRRHLHNLNPEQRSAVEYGIHGDAEPPPALLIAAGAGTGKTKTLAHRVAHLILNGSDPQRLLLLTFTRRAALEMTRRSQAILAEARGDCIRGIVTPSSLLPWSGTFHAIGSRLLRLHADSIGSTRRLPFSTAPIRQISSTSCAASSACRRPRRASPGRTPAWRSTRTPSTPPVRSKTRSPGFSMVRRVVRRAASPLSGLCRKKTARQRSRLRRSPLVLASRDERACCRRRDQPAL